MSYFIAGIVSIVISLGISIYFYNLNKSDDPMNKVKKYADGREDELKKLFLDLGRQYNVIKTDFKAEQNKANASVKNLEQQNADFSRKIQLLQDNIETVQKIKSQIDVYSKKLNDLNEMTDNVEENLERLKNSGQIIAKVSNKISEQETAVSQLEKRIPEITKEFSEQNVKQLKAIGAELLKEYENYAQKISQDVTDAKKSADDVLNKIRQEFQNAYDEAASRAENLENIAFEHLSEQAKNRSDKFLEQVKSQSQSLQQTLENNVATVSAGITQKFEKLSADLDEKSANFETQNQNLQHDFENKVAIAKNGVAQKLKELSDNMIAESAKLKDSFEKKHAETIQTYKTSEEKFATETKIRLSTVNERFNKKMEEVSADFAGKVDALQKKYSQSLENVKNKNDSVISQAEELVNQDNQKLAEKIAALQTKNQENYDAISKKFQEDYAAFVEQYSKEFENSKEASNKKIAEFSAENKNAVDSLQAKIESRLNKLSIIEENCKNRLEEIQNNFEKNINQCNSLSENLKTEIFSVQNELKKSLEEISQKASDSVEKAENSVQHIKSQCDDAEKRAATIQSDLKKIQNETEEKIATLNSDTSRQIDSFQIETNGRLENLSKTIADSVKKAVSESEAKHLSVLENVDSQLNSYKKDIEYKLSQIQFSQSDVDNLEKSLRAAMTEIQTRLSENFEDFKASQEQKHKDFNNKIKQDSLETEEKLKIINDSLDDLKTTATGSLNAKLAEFESSFSQTLSAKHNQVDTDLAEWKRDLDSKLTILKNDYEDSRREIETKYAENFKTNIEALQSKSINQIEKISFSLEQKQTELEDLISETQRRLLKFKQETNDSISEVSKNSEEKLQQEIEQNANLIQKNLEKVKQEFLSDFKGFQEAIDEQQETSKSAIDTALSEFKMWKNQIRAQFDDADSVFKSELDAFKQTQLSKIDDAKQELSQNITNYETEIQNQHEALKIKIADLDEKAENSLKKYENASAEHEKKLQTMYDNMLAETEQKIERQNDKGLAYIETFKSEIQREQTENSKMFLRMQDESTKVQTYFAEIQKEIQETRDNIQLFERADKMKRRLDEDLRELENSFSRIEDFSKSADGLKQKFKAVTQIGDEISEKLKSLENDKNRMNSLEQNFNRMIALSGTIDDRINSLNSTMDDLQTKEVAVRNYEDRLKEVSNQYERLEKKDEVVERINVDVSSQFEKIKDLEKRLNDCNRQVVSLPQEIKDVQANVDAILRNEPKISDAIVKLENLETLVVETGKRMDALNSVQNGIKKTELDLQGLSRDINSKFKALQQIAKQDLEKSPLPAGSAISQQVSENVRILRRQGWEKPEIAKRLNLTENEVDLILELPE